MFEWSEQQRQIRDMLRRFVQAEIVPHREALEFGDTPPYDILRKFLRTFGADEIRDAGEGALHSSSLNGKGVKITSSTASAPAASIARRSNPSAMPEAGGI